MITYLTEKERKVLFTLLGTSTPNDVGISEEELWTLWEKFSSKHK